MILVQVRMVLILLILVFLSSCICLPTDGEPICGPDQDNTYHAGDTRHK